MTKYTITVDDKQAKQVIDDRLMVKVPKVLGESVHTTGDKIAQTASMNAPVDTGELSSSIHYEKISEFEGKVVVDAEHGPYVEFGTYKMMAQPYLGPAAQEHGSSFVKDTKAKVKTAVEN